MRPNHSTSAPKGNAGVTLVELMVALLLSTIVIFAIFLAWSSLSRHLTVQSRRTRLETESQRIGRDIVSDIRRAPAILSIGQSSISLTSDRRSDTITYERNSYPGELLCNGKPLTLLAPDAKVTIFSLAQESGSAFASDSGVLLTVRVGLTDDFGDSSVYSYKVSIRQPPQNTSGAIQGWNF
jgi:hypothetical protein